jgi:diguanylate cyclase (GGDEF)-like protein
VLQSTEPQRLRQVEVERRIFAILLTIGLVLWGGLGLLALSYPLRDVLITGVAGAVYMGYLLVSERRVAHSPAPLAWLVGQEVGVMGLLAYVMTWSGGVQSPALPMTIVIGVIIGVRFPPRWAAAQVTGDVAVIVTAMWLGDAELFRASPVQVLSWVFAFVLAALVANMLSRAERGARRDALHDALTGLLNRTALHARLEEARAQPSRRAETLSVIAADLDGLKAVNDRFGHDAGDAVLRAVAASLSASVREGDLLYRLGGDEFVIILPGTPTGEAAELAERLRAAVGVLHPSGRSVTLSVGVSGVLHGIADLEHLLSHADRALYAAKTGGRDRVRIAEPGTPVVPPTS